VSALFVRDRLLPSPNQFLSSTRFPGPARIGNVQIQESPLNRMNGFLLALLTFLFDLLDVFPLMTADARIPPRRFLTID